MKTVFGLYPDDVTICKKAFFVLTHCTKISASSYLHQLMERNCEIFEKQNIVSTTTTKQRNKILEYFRETDEKIDKTEWTKFDDSTGYPGFWGGVHNYKLFIIKSKIQIFHLEQICEQNSLLMNIHITCKWTNIGRKWEINRINKTN